jgi:hypothetical protein
LLAELTHDLLSNDHETRNTAVDIALKLAGEGDDCAIEAIEQAIRQRRGDADCVFYELSRSRAYDQSELNAASAELLNLAVTSQLWLRPPAEVQRLMARSAIVKNAADLLKEIEQRAGEDQAHAFQLLGTHLQARARLTKARETARPGSTK